MRVLLALFLAAAPAAAAECRIAKVAEVPIDLQGGKPTLTAKVNGKDVRFVADTGAFYSLVTPAAAERARMRTVRTDSYAIGGVGGSAQARAAQARSFDLGNLHADNIEFLLGAENLGDVGPLGQNVLGNSDIEFDLANGVMRILRAQGCGRADLAYWAEGNANVLPITRTEGLANPPIMVRVDVQGRGVNALLDTGADTSFLTLDAAKAAGVKTSATASGLSGGIGKRMVQTYSAPVTSFTIGRETIRNTQLRVADTSIGEAEMLLGIDFFLSHRIYVSKDQRRLYFTYNGGPVFRPAVPAASAAKVPAPDAEGLTAEARLRRSQGMLVRGDVAAAESELDAAVAKDPGAAVVRMARARLRLRLKQEPGALDDLDAVLKASPRDAEALVLRGRLRLRRKDVAGGRADLHAAVAAEPDDADIMLSAALGFEHERLLDEAQATVDRWTASHPRDSESITWQLLNKRCWLRARMNRDLDKALADCNLAVGRAGQNPTVLDSRALVKLRQGRLREALADYNAALRPGVASAWTLYARGLTHARLGNAAQAEADKKAALKADPEVAEDARRLGLES